MGFKKLINKSIVLPLLLQTCFSHIKHAILVKSTKNISYINNQLLYFLVYCWKYPKYNY